MRNFIFILLFSFVSLFAQVQEQQQRANNATPYTIAIHRLNNLALNDSLLMETEDTTNFYSRRTSVGDLKSYINSNNSNNLSIQFFANFENDTLTPNCTYSGPQKYDDDGDSIKITIDYVNSQNFYFYLKKPNGHASNLSSYTFSFAVDKSVYRATSAQLISSIGGLVSYSGISAFYDIQLTSGYIQFYGPTTPIGQSSAEPAWDGIIYIQLDINK